LSTQSSNPIPYSIPNSNLNPIPNPNSNLNPNPNPNLGEYIVREGERNDSFFVVKSGECESYKKNERIGAMVGSGLEEKEGNSYL
jgi:hypothetical protein